MLNFLILLSIEVKHHRMLVVRVQFPLSIVLIRKSLSVIRSQIVLGLQLLSNLKELFDPDDEILLSSFISHKVLFRRSGNISITLDGPDCGKMVDGNSQSSCFIWSVFDTVVQHSKLVVVFETIQSHVDRLVSQFETHGLYFKRLKLRN